MNSAATGHGKGPKSTPLLAAGRLYTLGITGVLSALDAATGKVAWRHGFDKEFGPPPDFGTAMSPIFDSGLLIAHVGGIKRRRAAGVRSRDRRDEVELDAATVPATPRRSRSWPAACARSSPNARRTIVGVDAATGARLWSLPFVTPYDQNAVTPVVSGDMVILSGLDQSTFAVRPTQGAAGSGRRSRCGTRRRSRCT